MASSSHVSGKISEELSKGEKAVRGFCEAQFVNYFNATN